MKEHINQIYDRMFKRIFSLSNIAIINLINGLFNTNYPPDSTVEYPNKEFVSATLTKRFADILVFIQGVPYHLEAQMTTDKSIAVRAFEYGFQTAMSTGEDDSVIKFPEPIIIYLDTAVIVPETSRLTVDFGTQGTFQYRVRNFKYQEHEIKELNQKKLIILIPFQLLKLRKIIEKSPTHENFNMLQDLIMNDILCSIGANLTFGNITKDDASQLRELTLQLYDHIYSNYEQLGGFDDMKPLLEGALELPLDKYRIRIDELEQEKASLEQKEATLENEKAALEKEKAAWEKEKAELLMKLQV